MRPSLFLRPRVLLGGRRLERYSLLHPPLVVPTLPVLLAQRHCPVVRLAPRGAQVIHLLLGQCAVGWSEHPLAACDMAEQRVVVAERPVQREATPLTRLREHDIIQANDFRFAVDHETVHELVLRLELGGRSHCDRRHRGHLNGICKCFYIC